MQKLTKRKAEAGDIVDKVKEEKEPKIRKQSVPAATVYGTFLPLRNEEITRVSRLFEGKEFNVIDEPSRKKEIEKLLQEHMGKVVQNPGQNTFCILIGNPEMVSLALERSGLNK